MRIIYEKLVRDRIPEIMDREGVRYEVGTLDPDGVRALQACRREERSGFERRVESWRTEG